MCGIAGVFRLDGAAADPVALDTMLDTIRHRGPDDRGVWSDGACALGHVRLSILDLSRRGHQPMLTDDGRGVLAYNGEVYNFPELRRDLENEGVVFHSTCDAEVVLEALHRWGPTEAVPRFNGMFAFAYYDRRDDTLWLARDRVGIKSLSLSEQDGALIFCSEMKGLLAHPDVPCHIDRDGLNLFLVYERQSRRSTVFEGVESLEPGTIRRIRGKATEVTRYFQIPQCVDVGRLGRQGGVSLSDGVRDVEAALVDSVRMHLASDAPLATMCSGGVDSSLVTALAVAERPDVTAYVADVGGPASEAAQAERVGRHLGVSVQRVPIDREEFLRLWPEATWHRDSPSLHPSDGPLLAVARKCHADGVKVLLTGEGSDEIFGGYIWYAKTYRLWRKARLRSRFPWPLRKPWSSRWRLWRKAPHSDVPVLGQHRLRRRLMLAMAPDVELGGVAIREHLSEVEPPEDRAFLTHQLDDLCYHLGWILHRHDRIGMGASIEMRVPFLENRLINLGLHLPRRLKLRGRTCKWILKKVAERWLPRNVVYARKKGFPVSPDLYRGATGLLADGVLPDLLRWTRDQTRRMAPLVDENTDIAYQLASAEVWARIFLRGDSPAQVAERLCAVTADAQPTIPRN